LESLSQWFPNATLAGKVDHDGHSFWLDKAGSKWSRQPSKPVWTRYQTPKQVVLSEFSISEMTNLS